MPRPRGESGRAAPAKTTSYAAVLASYISVTKLSAHPLTAASTIRKLSPYVNTCCYIETRT